MKNKNPYLFAFVVLVLIIISLLIINFSTNYHIVTIDTESMEKYSEKLSLMDSVYINIDNNDFQKAISIIEKSNISDKHLLEALENQKSAYTLIIVFLTALIAAAGLFNIVQNLTSKSEQEKFIELTGNIEKEVFEMRFQIIINDIIRDETDINSTNSSFYLKSGLKVNNLEKFKLFITDGFSDFDKKLNTIKMYDRFYNNKKYYHILANWIIGTNNYALNKKYIKNGVLDVSKNNLFRWWILNYKSKMKIDHFDELKKLINDTYDNTNIGKY